jgi:hypothetical protein
MPRIFITQPFLHHCAGTIFDLADEIGISGWSEGDMITDFHNLKKNYCYYLPDNGRGEKVELLVSWTGQCDETIFNDLDLKSGPCRITFVSKNLEALEDPYYADPLPKGRGKVVYDEQDTIAFKNRFIVETAGIAQPDEMIVLNAKNKELKHYFIAKSDIIHLDFTTYSPGFYNIYLNKNGSSLHHFKMIKLFPIVLELDPKAKEYTIAKTLW